ncbi:MAG: PIN domain-containing protein [Thermoguttaceae bacterium]
MKVLLDTSTLVAAMLADHAHHLASHEWLVRGKTGGFEFFVSAHSLVEAYSVLTRLPRKPPITSADAWKLLRENVVSVANLVTLSGSQCAILVEDLSKTGIIGGAAYDGLIARAAEQSQVDKLVTLNDTHFRRIWPTGADRVVSPRSLAPPSA